MESDNNYYMIKIQKNRIIHNILFEYKDTV